MVATTFQNQKTPPLEISAQHILWVQDDKAGSVVKCSGKHTPDVNDDDGRSNRRDESQQYIPAWHPRLVAVGSTLPHHHSWQNPKQQEAERARKLESGHEDGHRARDGQQERRHHHQHKWQQPANPGLADEHLRGREIVGWNQRRAPCLRSASALLERARFSTIRDSGFRKLRLGHLQGRTRYTTQVYQPPPVRINQKSCIFLNDNYVPRQTRLSRASEPCNRCSNAIYLSVLYDPPHPVLSRNFSIPSGCPDCSKIDGGSIRTSCGVSHHNLQLVGL